MKIILKLLFGRLTIISLQILLQLAVLFYFIYIFQNLYVYIALYVLSAIAVLDLLNKGSMPDNKIPWLIFVLAAPMFGTLSYFMFSRNGISNRQKRLFKKINLETAKYISVKDSIKTLDKLKEYSGQSRYLYSTCNKPPYSGVGTKYFAEGIDFYRDLLLELKRAKKFIFMEYFIIKKGTMWNSILEILKQKTKEGVEVRIIYDDIGCISKLPMFYPLKLKKLGIKCVKFNRFLPIVSAIHNNRDHRKITVIDGKTGYVGGINLSDEYINLKERFGHWKDSAVKLNGEGAKSLTLMFLQMYNLQKKKIENFSPYILDEYEKFESEGTVHVFEDGPNPVYNSRISLNAYLNIINQAKKYLYITTPYMVMDYTLKNAIISAAKRGVDVRIITPHKPDKKIIFYITKSNYKHLIMNNVKIYEYTPGFIHSKNILCDDKAGIVGTVNLDYRSLVHHYECGVWMYKAKAIKELKEDFIQTFEKCELIDITSAKLNFLQRLFCNLLTAFTPLL